MNKAKRIKNQKTIKKYCKHCDVFADERHLASAIIQQSSTASPLSNRAKLLESRVTFLHFLGCGKALSRCISLGIAQLQYLAVGAWTLIGFVIFSGLRLIRILTYTHNKSYRVRIFFGNYYFFNLGIIFFSMVAIGGGDGSGGGGLSLQRT